MIRIWIAAGTLSLGLLATGAIGPAQAGINIDIVGGGGGRISCREGARVVRYAGFRDVRPIDCSGSSYSYRGVRRHSLFEIRVRSKSGRISDVIRLRGRGGGGYDDDDDYDDDDY